MRVLLSSPAFAPSVGGLEAVVALSAEGFARRGHQVVVVTTTPAGEAGEARAAYRVVRRPSPLALLRWVRWCEVFFQANVSLRGLWPLLVVRRPWVVSHHSWYCRTDGRVAWQDQLKRRLLRYASASIAVSRAMAADLGTDTLVIPNPYRDDLFRRLPAVLRERELIFVGRLVSDKGADLLLAALGRLAGEGLRPHLTVVGDGPERPALEAQASTLGLAGQLRFRGLLAGEELVRELNAHQVLVAPSRYQEPFGLVALEGIACGCVVVGSAGGGLPEAIGPCGLTFPNSDIAALAGCLASLLTAPARRQELLAGAADHLAAHRAERVIDRYLAVLAPLARRAA